MPELPEVETMVRGVRPQILGATIERVEFCRCLRKPLPVFPNRKTIQRQAPGHRICSIERVAKRICIGLSNDETAGSPIRFFVIEPRMTGLLLVADPPSVEHRRVCWHLRLGNEIRQFEFWDRRGLGTVSWYSPIQLQTVFDRLGPDALAMTPSSFATRLSKTAREIKVALLDQSLVAGIGNLYASEILHRAAISPLIPANQLRHAQLKRLCKATLEVLETAIRYEGSTLSDGTYRNALNESGSYQNEHRVYDKAGMLCTRCQKQTITRIVQAQRSTFFCPNCQGSSIAGIVRAD